MSCAAVTAFSIDRPNMRLYNSQLFNMPYEMLATALVTPNENPFVQVPLPSAFPLNPLQHPASSSPMEDIRPSCPYTSYLFDGAHPEYSRSGHRDLSGPA